MRQFLTNGTSVFEALQHLVPDVGRVQRMMGRALELADTFASSGRSDLAVMLRKLISRIEVQSDRISIAVEPARITCLALRASCVVADSAALETVPKDSASVVVTVPLLRRRVGRDTRLLVDGPAGMQTDPALVRVLVRARACKVRLLQSGEASLTETSRSEGISRSYLTRLARLGFLAPDIVCAILDGRQPARLTAARLIRITQLPLDWSGQRKALGFG